MKNPSIRRAEPLWLSAVYAVVIAAGPVAVAQFLVAAEIVWIFAVTASDATTAALYAGSPLIQQSPGHTVEALRFVLCALLAAIPPALGIGAFERSWRAWIFAAAVFYPAWLMVMLAPAIVVRHYADQIDPARHGVHLSADFLVLFSAAATSIALGFSLWTRLRPDVYGPKAEAISVAV